MEKPTLWERYLTKEIGIEFKACLYFFGFLFYYCTYRLIIGSVVAEILHMAEMIFLTYIIGYVQVYLLWNFDEADSVGGRELLGVTLCTVLYTAAAYIFKWFDQNIWVTIGFAAYVILMYVCVILIYKCRRRIDDKILNSSLEIFKARNEEK